MADVEEPGVEAIEKIDEKMSMSRGEKEEVVIDFSKCSDIYVYDHMGNKIRFGDIYKKQKTLIILTRHLLDFVCQEYVEDLASIPEEYLQEAEVRLVVIAPSPYKHIKNFKQDTGYRYTLYCDPDYDLFRALGCQETTLFGKMQESKHIKSGVFMGVLRSTWRVVKEEARMRPGDVKQQGGSFILGPGEEVHHAHVDRNVTDHCNINTLLTLAGVQNVSFPKDPRVLEI